jgi:hypothetical protein
MNRKSKRHKSVSAYLLSILAILITLLAGIPSCSNREAQNEQFDSNPGIDRDHTEVHKEDTLKVNPSEIRDSISTNKF